MADENMSQETVPDQLKNETAASDSANQPKNETAASDSANQPKNETADSDSANQTKTEFAATLSMPLLATRSHFSFRKPTHCDHTKKELATTLPLFALNHISFLVRKPSYSAHFYEKVLGFVIIKRPKVFDYEGVWMFGHGVSLHLLGPGEKEGDNKYCGDNEINPINNHISFQCSNLYSMMRVLQTSHVKFERFQTKQDGKIVVDRINFYDPDGHMIEFANSQNLPIVPLSNWPPKSMPTPNLEFITTAATAKEITCKPPNKCTCDYDQADKVFDLENTPSEHHLLAMNHVGYLCNSLEKSLDFYKGVLGFVSIEVPNDENWNKKIKRAWLFGHGIGVHLMQKDCACPTPFEGCEIDPHDNGIAFQCTNMYKIITRLEETKHKYVSLNIKEDGIIVNQIFFHDPDGNMIEFCTFQNLPIVPISDCPPQKMPTPNLDPFTKELPCKPKWPPCKCNKVDEECYEICYKKCKPKVVKCCDEIITCDTVQEELKSCTIQE